jgi:hypothetical protein
MVAATERPGNKPTRAVEYAVSRRQFVKKWHRWREGNASLRPGLHNRARFFNLETFPVQERRIFQI